MSSPRVSGIRKSTHLSRRSSSFRTRQRSSLVQLPSSASSPKLSTRTGSKRLSSSRSSSSEDLNGAKKETNINVYVRCRARNEREVKENSGVILTTNGVHGKEVTVHGANSYNDKTYTYDDVFGPESDQEMVFNTVAVNSLNQVIAGYNCTIFAYGQTGTGKTYTMTGDLEPNKHRGSRPADKAGIIPRVLFDLFKQLEAETGEFSVKVSYIELYNEELKDLLAIDDTKKVRIFDDASNKKSVTIHGMEEVFIRTPDQGMKVLREGSNKRQEAATKCNDHSSRSHSVFTITVNIKQITPDGQELVRVGKLNLVDLAGSENINRSGAENKRAREAGMINQSLLTLGRVINSLVEHSPHIPYRESKLTRILQDSLGGKTKTCIIATCSPAKASLDETLSTLEYASRAKSIKNKPQMNQKMSKQAHILDYVAEIERLRADLNASRQKNGGIYLTEESYNALTEESESRRILIDEQKMRLDVVEKQVQEYRNESENYTKNMNALRESLGEKDSELKDKTIRLDEVTTELTQTKQELHQTTIKLDEEIKITNAYKDTEKQLSQTGAQLIDTLENTVSDVSLLHDKIERIGMTNAANVSTMSTLKDRISEFCSEYQNQQNAFLEQYTNITKDISFNISQHLVSQLRRWDSALHEIDAKMSEFETVKDTLFGSMDNSNHASLDFLDTITSLRNEMKTRIEEGLKDVVKTSEMISKEISTQLAEVDIVVQSSYRDLGQEFRQILKHIQVAIGEEGAEIEKIQTKIKESEQRNEDGYLMNHATVSKFMEEERSVVEKEKAELLEKMTEMVSSMSERRCQSITENLSKALSDSTDLRNENKASFDEFHASLDTVAQHFEGIDQTTNAHAGKTEKSLDEYSSKMSKQVGALRGQCELLSDKVEDELNTQVENLDNKMECLGTFVNEAKQQHTESHQKHIMMLNEVASCVNAGFDHDKVEFLNSKENAVHNHEQMGDQIMLGSSEVDGWTQMCQNKVQCLEKQNADTDYVEVEINGSTPLRGKEYKYTTQLPKTGSRDEILAAS